MANTVDRREQRVRRGDGERLQSPNGRRPDATTCVACSDAAARHVKVAAAKITATQRHRVATVGGATVSTRGARRPPAVRARNKKQRPCDTHTTRHACGHGAPPRVASARATRAPATRASTVQPLPASWHWNWQGSPIAENRFEYHNSGHLVQHAGNRRYSPWWPWRPWVGLALGHKIGSMEAEAECHGRKKRGRLEVSAGLKLVALQPRQQHAATANHAVALATTASMSSSRSSRDGLTRPSAESLRSELSHAA